MCRVPSERLARRLSASVIPLTCRITCLTGSPVLPDCLSCWTPAIAELSWRCRRGGTGRGAGAWPCRDWPIRCLSRGGAIASKPGRGSGVCVACRGGTLFRARPEGRRAERRAGRAGGADLPAGRVMQGMMDGRKEVEKRAGSCVPDAGKTSRASGPLRHAGSNGTEAEPPPRGDAQPSRGRGSCLRALSPGLRLGFAGGECRRSAAPLGNGVFAAPESPYS